MPADEPVARAIQEIDARQPLRPLIATHEMVGRMLLRRFAGLTPDQALGRPQPRHKVYRVSRSAGRFEELSTAP